MRKIYRLPYPLPAIDGLLVKRATLHEGLRATSLHRQARQRAARVLRQARRQAAACRSTGWLQGYAEGVLAGAGQLIDNLRQLEVWQAAICVEVNQLIAERLQAVLPDPALGLSLLQAWLAQHPAAAGTEIECGLPRSWRLAWDCMALSGAYDGLRLVWHDGEHFQLRAGERAFCFSPTEAGQRLSLEIQRDLRLQQLLAECEVTRQRALANLAAQWQLAPSPAV